MKAIRRNPILAIVALVLAALAFCLPIGADTVENDDLAVDLASENSVTLVTSEGKTDYSIIYASDAVNDDNAIADELRSELYFKYEAIVSLGIDVISDEKPHEIIIGDTVREATKEFKEYVMGHSEDGKYLVTGIAYLDGKLVFLSSHAEGYTYYRDMLFSLLTEDGMIVTEGLYDVKKILYTDYLEELRQKAEAEKEAAILKADGEAQAIRTVQQALADSMGMLNQQAPNEQVIKLKSIQAMEKVADGKATKIIIPSEMQGLVGLATGLVEGTKKD